MTTSNTSTSNDVTDNAILLLKSLGFRCWRQNVIGIVNGRKVQAKRGLSDIIGYRKRDAVWLAVEVKTGRDVLSPEQREFLIDLIDANGIAFVISLADDVLRMAQSNFAPDAMRRSVQKRTTKKSFY